MAWRGGCDRDGFPFPDMLKMIALACVAGMVTADMASAQEARQARSGRAAGAVARPAGGGWRGDLGGAHRLDDAEIPDKPAITNLPPRTVMKVELPPAQGSHIKVEIWLPDEARWNGRLLGLGNGGAAGHINPQPLAWPAQGGYAVATTDMGTAPDADRAWAIARCGATLATARRISMTLVAKQAVQAYYGRGPEFFRTSMAARRAASRRCRRRSGIRRITRHRGRHPVALSRAAACVFLWNDQIFAKCPFTQEQERR